MENREATDHIWLRYSTQFQRDGRNHTIEMSVPMPIGANTQQRAQLITEAEEGMRQLVSHVETRFTNLITRKTQTSQASHAVSVKQPTQSLQTAAVSRPVAQDQLNRSDSISTGTGSNDSVVPQNNLNVGATMPLALGPTLDSSGNLRIPEFIQYIKEYLHLDVRQAMRLLNVKSLSGINLREALDRLKVITNQQNIRMQNDSPPLPPDLLPDMTPEPTENETSFYSRATLSEPLPLDISMDNVVRPQERKKNENPPRGFDEEEGPDDEFEPLIQDQDIPFSHNLTPEQIQQAHDKIDKLRATQGAAVASNKRLQVLTNVTDGQITPEQLEELIFSIWEVAEPKKLKIEQVESLISWAKQDYFIEEVEAALIILEEERYARRNR